MVIDNRWRCNIKTKRHVSFLTDREITTTNKMIALIVLGVLSATNAQLMGGWSDLTNQTTIQIMSSFAMSALTAQSGGNMDYSGCKVTHSAQQVIVLSFVDL